MSLNETTLRVYLLTLRMMRLENEIIATGKRPPNYTELMNDFWDAKSAAGMMISSERARRRFSRAA